MFSRRSIFGFAENLPAKSPDAGRARPDSFVFQDLLDGFKGGSSLPQAFDQLGMRTQHGEGFLWFGTKLRQKIIQMFQVIHGTGRGFTGRRFEN